MVWLKFIFSIIIIFFSGSRLSRYGDTISETTGLGKGFVGVLLLGAITSLPELITTISSVSLVKDVNLAWGNIYGSNLLNLSVIAFCDIFIKNKYFRIFNKNNILTGILGIIITAVGICGILMHVDWVFFNHVSIFTVIILITYISGAYILYLNEKARKSEIDKFTIKNKNDNTKIYLLFFIHSLLIIAAGINITYACEDIAKITGLGTSFVGSIFLALATSLPEIVVSITAIKLGAVSMAVGNILGSNFFNVSIIGISDIFYTSGSRSIYFDASKIHAFTGTIFIILTNIYLVGMILGSKKRIFKLGIDSILIIFLYFLTFYYLFLKS